MRTLYQTVAVALVVLLAGCAQPKQLDPTLDRAYQMQRAQEMRE